MRYTDNPDIDAEIETLVRKNLFRIDRFIASMGYAPLSKDELRSIYQFASSQARQAAQQAKTQPANLNIAPQGKDFSFQNPLLTGQGPRPPQGPETLMNLKLNPADAMRGKRLEGSPGFGSI